MAHDQIRDKVIFTYETRSSFKINSAEIWKKEYENKLESRVIKDGFPTTFPKIEMVEGNKSNPGLQVTDFILWATSKRIKDSIDSKLDWYNRPGLDDWYDRLHLNLLDTFNTTDNYIQGGTIGINKELHIHNIVYPKISLNKVDPRYAYLNIERYLRNIAQFGLPNHASNHSERLDNLIKKLDNATMDHETLREVATLFLILFDTIPIYNNSTDKIICASLIAIRNLSRLWLNERSADGSWQKIHILRWRYENFKLHPQLFLEDPFS